MSTQQERLIKLLNDRKITAYRLSKETGITQSTLSRFINAPGGKVEMHPETIDKIAKYFEVPFQWLLHGDGEMAKNTSAIQEALDLSDDNSMKYYYELSATAGNDIWIDDNELNQPYRRINFPNFEGCVAFNVSGESMYPTAKERDIVAIIPEEVQIIVNGEIYLVITRDGQRMVKRLRKNGKDETGATIITCISDNENQELYAPFTISGNDVHKIFRVKGFISSSLLA